jgi:hypothetical protein
MTADEFLAMWLVLTITVGYLGLVTLFCFLVPRIARWVTRQNVEPASGRLDRSTD